MVQRPVACARDVLRSSAVLSPEAEGAAAFAFFADPNQPDGLPVVDGHGRVIGLLDRSHLLALAGRPHGRAVFERRPVTALISGPPLVVTAETPLSEVGRRLTRHNRGALASGFVITEGGRYAGVGTGGDVLEKLAEEEAARASELSVAREQALAASAAKSRFLALMSHEMRTPLNGVLGYLELLAEEGIGDDARQYVTAAETSARSLLTLVTSLLDFSRIEAGRLEVRIETCDPLRVTDESLTAVRPVAARRGLHLAEVVGDGVPLRLDTDPDRLREILLNLIGNAVKFTEVGGVQVTVASDPSGAFVQWTVADSGPGFDPTRGDELWEPFRQLDDSTTRRHDGVGLGLSIVRGLVGLLGGTAGAEGYPGVGARFWFRLPQAPSPVVVAVPQLAAYSVHVLAAAEEAQHWLTLLGAAGARVRVRVPSEGAVELGGRRGGADEVVVVSPSTMEEVMSWGAWLASRGYRSVARLPAGAAPVEMCRALRAGYHRVLVASDTASTVIRALGSVPLIAPVRGVQSRSVEAAEQLVEGQGAGLRTVGA